MKPSRFTPAADVPHPFQHIALARGINVGGKNRLTMSALAEAFTQSGAAHVTTCIQSGNVMFDAAAAERCVANVMALLDANHALRVPLLHCTTPEFLAATKRNPFLGEADPAHLSMGLLSGLPVASAVKSLDPNRSPGDRFHIGGRFIYLHQPGGIARSKLTNAWFDGALGLVSTFRNWKVALAIAAIASGVPAA